VPHDALRKYADCFDVSADYLLGRTDKPDGKLYTAKPAFLNDNEQLQQFIEMENRINNYDDIDDGLTCATWV
jgi:hypothetical protein